LHGKVVLRWLGSRMRVERIEELMTPFAAVAQDLDTGDEVVLREGSITEAMRCSMGMPGLFPPYAYRPPGAGEARRFVDGGLVNNIPVDVVRAMGADRVVACHVTRRRIAGARAGMLVSGLAKVPTVERALTLLQAQLGAHVRLGERQVLAADVSIQPDTSRFSYHEFGRGAGRAETGRRAARALQRELERLIT